MQIPLTRGQFALIDDEDLDLVSGRRWHAHPCQRASGGFYATGRNAGGGTLYMHRLILGAVGRSVLVDHINGDGLDNTRANIRIATRSQNLINRRAPAPSGYRGIRQNRAGKWYAAVTVNRKATFACGFDTPEEAARAYDELALRHHGSFAMLNFPLEGLAA